MRKHKKMQAGLITLPIGTTRRRKENHILISNQTEKPPEFKHITKGRKRK